MKADPAFSESIRQYYRFMKENKSKPVKVGLQRTHMPEPANRRLRHSGIYRNPALTQGQKLYLLQKCHVKIHRKTSHLFHCIKCLDL